MRKLLVTLVILFQMPLLALDTIREVESPSDESSYESDTAQSSHSSYTSFDNFSNTDSSASSYAPSKRARKEIAKLDRENALKLSREKRAKDKLEKEQKRTFLNSARSRNEPNGQLFKCILYPDSCANCDNKSKGICNFSQPYRDFDILTRNPELDEKFEQVAKPSFFSYPSARYVLAAKQKNKKIKEKRSNKHNRYDLGL